ncbi:MAG: hypothetical protein Q8T03_01880 [Bacteroidota bacterium]|nr:hypothetical protein [Bacteroidota bacterium]
MSENNENNNLNNEPNNFGLPTEYFQYSANAIMNKIDWIEEHKAFSCLSQLKKESGFIVPETYFIAKEREIELIDFPILASIKKVNGFITPLNYFEELKEKQFAELLNDSERSSFSFEKLNAIPKQNNFKVDGNYFVNSENKITSLLLNKKSGKVINLFSSKIWYAAAALLTITLGLWIYSQYFKPEAVGDCGTLACIDKIDILKSKALENIDNEQLYELVDTEKLEEKLENKTNNKNNKNNKKDLDTSLKNVSTEDLLDEI